MKPKHFGIMIGLMVLATFIAGMISYNKPDAEINKDTRFVIEDVAAINNGHRDYSFKIIKDITTGVEYIYVQDVAAICKLEKE